MKVQERLSSISNKQFLCLYLFFIFLLNCILGLQGFDMMDEGWCATAYQQVFNDPKSVQYLFMYYLSLLVGGIWDTLFGNFGLISLRFLAVIVRVLIAFVVYKTLVSYISRWFIFLGVFLAICCPYFGIFIFHHNHLSALLITSAIYFMISALKESKYLHMFVGGMLLGASLFARLPNFTMFFLIMVLIPYYINTKDYNKCLKFFAFYIFGYFFSAILIVMIMLSLGHAEVFIGALGEGFMASHDPDSSHSLTNLLKTYSSNYVNVLRHIVICFSLPLFFFVMYKNKDNLKSGIYEALLFLFFCIYSYVIFTQTMVLYIIYAVSTVVLLYGLFTYRCFYQYLSCLLLINLYFLPLGSDFGIGNMGENCVWLAAPFSFGFVALLIKSKIISLYLSKGFLKITCVLSILIVLMWFNNVRNTCYFDQGNRLLKTSLIDNPLATTFTTRQNCEMLNPLLNKLSCYVKPNDKLFCFQCIATVHYLTHTRPYLNNPLVWSYTPLMMKNQMDKVESEDASLPVVVRDKSIFPNWSTYYPDWNNDNAIESFKHKNKRITYMNEFLKKNNYKIVWENEIFQILLPGEK